MHFVYGLSVCVCVRMAYMYVRAQCRINHVADVANATGLRPQGASGSSEFFFSSSVVK